MRYALKCFELLYLIVLSVHNQVQLLYSLLYLTIISEYIDNKFHKLCLTTIKQKKQYDFFQKVLQWLSQQGKELGLTKTTLHKDSSDYHIQLLLKEAFPILPVNRNRCFPAEGTFCGSF